MIAEERQKALLAVLSKSEYTTLGKLFASFPDISQSTLRRDLHALTAQGKVILLRGGAKLPDKENRYDLPIDSKLHINTDSKHTMAAYASNLVNDSDVIFLDSSTSVIPILQFIANKDVKIVTAGVYTALEAMRLGLDCVLVGGDVRSDVGSVVGPVADEQLSRMYFNVSFMSSNGFSREHGISTPHAEEASKIKAVLKNSDRAYFLLDKSKAGLSFTYKAAELICANVISDEPSELADGCASFAVAKK